MTLLMARDVGSQGSQLVMHEMTSMRTENDMWKTGLQMDRKTWFPETDVDKSIEPPNQRKAIVYPWTSILAK